MHKKNYFSMSCIALLVFLFPFSNSLADSLPGYHVELIVFSHLTNTTLNSETWPVLDHPKVDLTSAISLLPASSDDVITTDFYHLLPNNQLKLSGISKRLAQISHYRVLLHMGWVQPINPPSSAKWIHIFGGNGYSDAGLPILKDADGKAAYTDAAHWQVDGLLRLDSIRYINATYRFIFAAPLKDIKNLANNPVFADTNNPFFYFKFDQSRRMRSHELNYMSHPLYGVLIEITPLEPKDHTTHSSNI